MIGFEIPWTRSALCAIQAVAIEPPWRRAMSRLVNALFAHFRDSMALFFHPSRIIRARGLTARSRSATAEHGREARGVVGGHFGALYGDDVRLSGWTLVTCSPTGARHGVTR